MRYSYFVPVTAAIIAFACSDKQTPGVTSFNQRDSAGIAIATNTASADSLPVVWALDTTGAVWIKSVDSIASTHFNRIAAIVLTSGGDVVVGNGQPAEVRVFDSNGSFVRTMAREGDGPGELRKVTDLFLGAADTITVSEYRFDFQLSRFAGATFIEENRLEMAEIARALPPGIRRGDGHAHVFPSGAFMISADSAKGSDPLKPVGESAPPGELTALWISSDRTRLRTMGKVKDMDIVLAGPPGARREVERLLPRTAKYGISAKHPARFCLAHNNSPEVHCVDDDGVQMIIRWQQREVSLEQSRIDSYKARVKDPNVVQAALTYLTYPPVFHIHVLGDHSVLVFSPDLNPGTPRRITGRLFSPRGELLGKVTFPPAFRPLYIEGDRAAGVSLDEDRGEQVVVYRLQKTRSS